MKLVGPITTAVKSVPTFSAHVLTADGLPNVTISTDFAKASCSLVHIAGTVLYVFNLVTLKLRFCNPFSRVFSAIADDGYKIVLPRLDGNSNANVSAVESDGSKTGLIPLAINGFDEPFPTVATLIFGFPVFSHADKNTLAACGDVITIISWTFNASGNLSISLPILKFIIFLI